MAETAQGPATAKGATETHEPERSLRHQGRRAAEARATVPDATFARGITGIHSEGAGNAIVAAFARALKRTPQANAAYRDAQIERYERVNVGLVLPDGDGTTSVTIADADTLSPAEVGELRDALAVNVAEGTLTAPQSAGSTCSVVDLSGTAVGSFATVLTPPHAVALAIGGKQPDGTITLTLTADQRVVAPHAAAALLDAIADELAR